MRVLSEDELYQLSASADRLGREDGKLLRDALNELRVLRALDGRPECMPGFADRKVLPMTPELSAMVELADKLSLAALNRGLANDYAIIEAPTGCTVIVAQGGPASKIRRVLRLGWFGTIDELERKATHLVDQVAGMRRSIYRYHKGMGQMARALWKRQFTLNCLFAHGCAACRRQAFGDRVDDMAAPWRWLDAHQRRRYEKRLAKQRRQQL